MLLFEELSTGAGNRMTGNEIINLREKVLEKLRGEIISGRGAAGTVYSVPGLASEMGMSTTPVREALLELSRVGLVTPLRNRGFRVEPTTLKDVEDVFSLRVLLERFALVTLANQGLSDTASLVALADAVGKAVERDNVADYIETDRRFHEALVSRVNNPRLTRMIMALRGDMRLYGIDTQEGRERQRASIAEHYQMIEYACAKDADRIGTLITQHIMEWKPLFIAALSEPSPRSA
jgi:DNA-binding GntR family transcriptional regulator